MSQEQGYGYTGLHAFVFIDEVDPGMNIREVIDDLRGLGSPPEGPVIFAAEMVGSSLGFAHIRVEDGDLAGLQDLIAGDLWDKGVHCKHCIEVDTGRRGAHLRGVKRDTPEIIAISKLKVRPGCLTDLLADLAALDSPIADTFKGASVIFGEWDVLLQLGGDDFNTVASAVYHDLQGIDGILDSDTLFTDGRR